MSTVVDACNFSTWVIEAGGSGVEGYTCLLGYIGNPRGARAT